MKKTYSLQFILWIAVSCLFAVVSFEKAEAKAACAEGRTASGKCIRPVMAAVQRKIMVAFTQPKISQSSKLISAVAAPAQIVASIQNVTIAQTSASTFENLRGPSSYEAQTHYNTTSVPDVYSLNGIYLTQAEFASIQTEILNYFNSHYSSTLSARASSYLMSSYCTQFFTISAGVGSGLAFSNVPKKI